MTMQKKQIEKKSGIPEYGINYVYEIKYANRHRIVLLEDNYINKHLNARGYCYTPHNKYDVFLGTHLNEMLNTLYGFFKEESFNSNIDINEHKNRQYKRILVGYTCNIHNDGLQILNENKEMYEKWQGIFSCLKFERDRQDVPEKSLDKFLHKTIAADVRRIFGSNYSLKQKNKLINTSFKINVLLIQGKVEENKGVEVDSFLDEYSQFENKAIYTVLHSAGKKYIKGGMPKVYIDKEKNPEPKRIYNLITALDSLYVQNEFNGQKVSIESSNIMFDKEEFNRKNNGNKVACGYRNIIVIEFYKPD